jgi:hypothetical protein
MVVWAPTKVNEDKMNILEGKILMKIYGPSYINRVWSLKYNDKLYTLFRELNIVQSIQMNKSKWLGHIRGIGENSHCKKLSFCQLEGSRKGGRPKLRWLDDVLQDVKTLKVTSWQEKAHR